LSDDITSEDDAPVVTSVVKIEDSDPTNFTNLGGVHPMPTGNDSIYTSDVDSTNSDIGDFTGDITDFFHDLFSVSENTTPDNPKTIKVWFKHSIQLYSMGFGCNETGKSFSNIKIKLFGSDEFIRETIDDSANNTKFTSKTYDFGPSKANGVIIEFHTADEICLSNIVIWKVNNVNSHILALDSLSGAVAPVGSFKGALNVHQSDVHNFMVNTNFHQHDTAATTVSTATVPGDTGQIVADTAGFSVNDKVEIVSGGVREINGAIITVIAAGAPGTLTYDRPLDNPYPIGATVERIVANLAEGAAGSLASPLSYIVAPPPGEIWHILRVLLSAVYSSAGDDGDFGNQGALTNGLVFRQNLATGLSTISVWKTNGEMKLDFFDLPYTDKAPAGSFGMNGRFTNKKVDVAYELIGDNGDFLEILRQDNITLTTLEFKAQGHKANV
jgi:hypothetical protein